MFSGEVIYFCALVVGFPDLMISYFPVEIVELVDVDMYDHRDVVANVALVFARGVSRNMKNTVVADNQRPGESVLLFNQPEIIAEPKAKDTP